MNVGDLAATMEALAPTRLAEAWDNVGLLVGDKQAALSRVLLAIDCTDAVVAEAREQRCEAVLSYHPPLFEAKKRFVAGDIAFELARSGIAVYSPHTALDVAAGGTNDVLADAVAMIEREPLRRIDAGETHVKLVTFVPEEHVDALSRALFGAGAGRIGDYTSCSFRMSGTGTFFGEEGANPTVGSAGRLEEAAEVRLETVVPSESVEAVVRALRKAHPYEEPAFDLVRLVSPRMAEGIGRVGLVETTPTRMLVDRTKRALGLSHVLCAGPLERDVHRVAVCAGSGRALLPDAVASGAEVYLTGELRHHDALAAVAAGLTVVCVLHSASERGVLVALERRLAERMPGVSFVQSRADKEPFVII